MRVRLLAEVENVPGAFLSRKNRLGKLVFRHVVIVVTKNV